MTKVRAAPGLGVRGLPSKYKGHGF